MPALNLTFRTSRATATFGFKTVRAIEHNDGEAITITGTATCSNNRLAASVVAVWLIARHNLPATTVASSFAKACELAAKYGWLVTYVPAYQNVSRGTLIIDAARYKPVTGFYFMYKHGEQRVGPAYATFGAALGGARPCWACRASAPPAAAGPEPSA